jgi:hypothetical protein
VSALIQFRRGTAAEWTAANPVLADGELGLETNSRLYKIGDGSTEWSALAYGTINGTIANLDDITNVVITSASAGQVLRWDGTNWVNGTATVTWEDDQNILAHQIFG